MLLAQQNLLAFEFTLTPLFEDHGLPLALMGILVVFMALALVVAFITVLPRILTSEAVAASAASGAADGVSQSPLVGDELSEETLVVITAAVAEVMDRPHRVVRIRGVLPADYEWSLEGRSQQHHSHKIQHRAR